MRASTIVFLLIFAGIFGHLRRQDDSASADSSWSQSEELTRHSQELSEQLEKSQQRYEHNARVLADLRQSVQRLQDVVKSAEVELARSIDRADDPVTIERRRQNLRRLERDLEQVRGGYGKIELDQERLEGDSASLSARLQLARAGIWEESKDGSASEPHAAPLVPDRPSPLDALTHLTHVAD